MSPCEIETGIDARERYDGTSVICRYAVDVKVPAHTPNKAIRTADYEDLRDRCRETALAELRRLLAPGGDCD